MVSTRMNRLVAFFIDYILVCIAVTIINLLLTWNLWFQSPTSTEGFHKLKNLSFAVIIIGLIITMSKDIIDGRSIGKRIINISVKDTSRNNMVPSTGRLFLRNITLIIWPIELIYFIITGNRIGDILFKTHVIND